MYVNTTLCRGSSPTPWISSRYLQKAWGEACAESFVERLYLQFGCSVSITLICFILFFLPMCDRRDCFPFLLHIVMLWYQGSYLPRDYLSLHSFCCIPPFGYLGKWVICAILPQCRTRNTKAYASDLFDSLEDRGPTSKGPRISHNWLVFCCTTSQRIVPLIFQYAAHGKIVPSLPLFFSATINPLGFAKFCRHIYGCRCPCGSEHICMGV